MNTDIWITKIDETTASFLSTFGNLSEEQLNFKPSKEVWSIAQNIDHLIVINKSFFPVIDSIRSKTYDIPFHGKMNFIVNFMGKTILKSVDPNRRKKMRTFPIWQPSKSELKTDLLPQFEKHHSDLKDLILNCQDLIEVGTVISSPANVNIVYKLDTAFDIITTHELRHFEQAKEVLSSIK